MQTGLPACAVALGATNGPPVQVLAPLVSVTVPAAGVEPEAATLRRWRGCGGGDGYYGQLTARGRCLHAWVTTHTHHVTDLL